VVIAGTCYTEVELSEAQQALASMLKKCVKTQTKLKEGSWRWRRMHNAVTALQRALELLADPESAAAMERSTLDEMDYELFAILQKIEKAQAGLEEGSSQMTLARHRIDALRLVMSLAFERLATMTDPGPFYHGTKASLALEDRLEPGHHSNFGSGDKANFIYFTATLDAATWGAELATGKGPGRIYLVEPTGAFENDPDLTNLRYPGNPTRSYRTGLPLRIVGAVADWKGHPAEVLKAMQDGLKALESQDTEAQSE